MGKVWNYRPIDSHVFIYYMNGSILSAILTQHLSTEDYSLDCAVICMCPVVSAVVQVLLQSVVYE